METTVQNDKPAAPTHQIVEQLQDSPAQGADDQKPDPASAADEQKAQQEETPEQKAEAEKAAEVRKQSRTQRAKERDAARLASAETELRLLREQIARDEAKRTPQAPPAAPKREDFDTLEQFHAAIAEHAGQAAAQKVVEAERKERLEREGKARSADSDRRVADAWGKAEEAFRKEAKDYNEVVAEFVESDLSDLDPSARRAMLESDLGPNLIYHLAKNPDEAERIAKLSPVRQVIEIGKLEDKVVPQKKQSSAPAPVSGVKGSSTSHGITGNETQAEYEAKRAKQGAKWAR